MRQPFELVVQRLDDGTWTYFMVRHGIAVTCATARYDHRWQAMRAAKALGKRLRMRARDARTYWIRCPN